ncbi:hypothetical protein GCM10011612_14290 [Actinomyces gaoshouyii]|uniref:Uncharacterized protein n=1 Tax=Actinomyces gaoshouyii TaxID=1960083 RepID=A0A8H9HEM0_9ACTO|nr:hypothetical protein GCM10011612_14290 [Actinomyces gaoshouyii]
MALGAGDRVDAIDDEARGEQGTGNGAQKIHALILAHLGGAGQAQGPASPRHARSVPRRPGRTPPRQQAGEPSGWGRRPDRGAITAHRGLNLALGP